MKPPTLGGIFPGHFFLEVRTGEKWAEAWTHDNDLQCMQTRYEYGAEMLKAGQGIRLRNWKGEVLKEKSYE